jgi:CBS domain-containing protein
MGDVDPAHRRAAGRQEAMSNSIREVMTPHPWTIAPGAPLMAAARVMRTNDIGDIVVTEGRRLRGILTDRDIVVRALAEGLDPATTTVGEICSWDLTTVTPDDSLGRAVTLMRAKAIRRLPVVEGGDVVGIVSIGDVALDRDRRSCLADISAAPPNT